MKLYFILCVFSRRLRR